MSIGKELVDDTLKMGDCDLPYCVSNMSEKVSVALGVAQWSPLAFGLLEVVLEWKSLDAPVREYAEQLAKKLSYLSEPIRVVEFDSQREIAQLRSNPPKSIDQGVEYFEISASKSGKVVLNRYQQTGDHSRQIIPFTLTIDSVARVVDDMVGGVANR